MAKIMSRLAIGCSIAIVLLMMFSVVPVAAENYAINGNSLAIDVTDDSDSSGTDWEWRSTDCVLNVYGESDYSKFTIKVGDTKEVTVNIFGDISLSYYTLDISSRNDTNIAKATINGPGSIVSEDTQIFVRADYTVINGITMNIKTLDGFSTLVATGDVLIKDCPSISFEGSDLIHGTISMSGNDYSLVVENTNLSLKNTGGNCLIDANGGITMPFEPSGVGLVYDMGPDNEWESGVTQIIQGPGPNCSLSMESYVPPVSIVIEDSTEEIVEDEYEWKPSTSTLTLLGGKYDHIFDLRSNPSNDKTPFKVVVSGDSSIVSELEEGAALFSLNYPLHVTGGHVLNIAAIGCIFAHSVTIENMKSITFDCSGAIVATDGDLLISNCESVVVNLIEYDTPPITGKTVTVEGSSLTVNVGETEDGEVPIIVGREGINLVDGLAADGVKCYTLEGFESGTPQESYDPETTAVITGAPNASYQITVGGPVSDNGNIPIYLGVALLVIVVVAVGIYMAFRS